MLIQEREESRVRILTSFAMAVLVIEMEATLIMSRIDLELLRF
jgi:hypothetical protein